MGWGYVVFGVLCCLGIGLGTAQETRPRPAITPSQKQPAVDWRVDVNKQVFKAQSWSWILRFIEKQGETLVIDMAYKNNASSARPIFLSPDFKTSTQLTDSVTAAVSRLTAVSGIGPEKTQVGRMKSKSARFTFAYPQGTTQIRFSSVWITVWMMNAAARMQVDFPIDLPH
ncbi:MAG: hypothetical protein V3S24_23120 [Candidatus Tectomicrobia bacterium]